MRVFIETFQGLKVELDTQTGVFYGGEEEDTSLIRLRSAMIPRSESELVDVAIVTASKSQGTSEVTAVAEFYLARVSVLGGVLYVIREGGGNFSWALTSSEAENARALMAGRLNRMVRRRPPHVLVVVPRSGRDQLFAEFQAAYGRSILDA